jgi:hypothetical protein
MEEEVLRNNQQITEIYKIKQYRGALTEANKIPRHPRA